MEWNKFQKKTTKKNNNNLCAYNTYVISKYESIMAAR